MSRVTTEFWSWEKTNLQIIRQGFPESPSSMDPLVMVADEASCVCVCVCARADATSAICLLKRKNVDRSD